MLTYGKKWHSNSDIFASPGGLFSDLGCAQVPKSLTFDQISGKIASRKRSPVASPGGL
ncbi:hypothetical protein [Burkholderia pseudomultivorans]|uniref:hypothetical protein n=1 Tax=Burkholderia pseudomultivorans TaxID=1207504 RepID=UPI0012D8C505|nr:hypothetical protein [Burkholderia pseudomultivorans]